MYEKMFFRFLGVSLLFLMLYGCKSEIDEYFDRPAYLRGNACEFLREKGNYTYFLKALELTDFSDALDGNGLYSVFAPDDEAFKRFMAKKSKTSLEEFDKDSLSLLIAYHLIEFSFNRNDFLAFSKTTSSENPEEGDGLCYKFETLAQPEIEELKDSKKKVYHQKKFLPIISTKLFENQESSDYEGDYKEFFPNIKWRGDKNQLYVANASVIESGIPLDNGYMYLVDEVIDFLPTVYQALHSVSSPKGKTYDLFRKLYDSFASFQYDADITKNYADLGDSLFMFYHYLPPSIEDDLPDIASEWSVRENEPDYEERLKYTANCFVPNDDVLEKYIKSFWGEGFDYTRSENLLKMYYLLKAHAPNHQTLILPSKIDQGIEGLLGEKWTLNRDDIDVAQLCSNGVLYGMDQVFEPIVFTMLMQPLFKYERFITMLNIGFKQQVFTTMVDPERESTIFLINDDNLRAKYGCYADFNGNPESNDVIGGRVVIKSFASEIDQTLVDMSYESQSYFVNNMVVNGFVEIGDDNSKRKFYSTQTPFNYLYVDKGVLRGEDHVQISPIETWIFDYTHGEGRGIVYEIGEKLGKQENSVAEELRESYQKFYEALVKAELIQVTETSGVITKIEMDWLKGERVMVFAPTDEEWNKSEVPIETDTLARVNFLKYFFVPLVANKMSDYILPNYGNPGTFETGYEYTPLEKAKMTISFSGDKQLNITNVSDGTGETVTTDGEIPYFAIDGVIFGIPDFIKAKQRTDE